MPNFSDRTLSDTDCQLLMRSGAVSGPFSKPLLIDLGKALREERWPLPLAVRTLRLRELAVLERRAMDEKKESKLRRVIKCWIF